MMAMRDRLLLRRHTAAAFVVVVGTAGGLPRTTHHRTGTGAKFQAALHAEPTLSSALVGPLSDANEF